MKKSILSIIFKHLLFNNKVNYNLGPICNELEKFCSLKNEIISLANEFEPRVENIQSLQIK